MTYEGMPIHEGGGAQLAYLDLMGGKFSPAETRTTLDDLKAYCGQDTMAMVKLLDHLLKRDWFSVRTKSHRTSTKMAEG